MRGNKSSDVCKMLLTLWNCNFFIYAKHTPDTCHVFPTTSMKNFHVTLPDTLLHNFALNLRVGNVNTVTTAPAVITPKLSLAFILDDNKPLLSPMASSNPIPSQHQRAQLPTLFIQHQRRKRKLTASEKRAARQCCIDGCTKYSIDRGLCFSHGGGKACSNPGCTASAKQRGLCWKHGGSTLCIIKGCTRGAKSRKLCWSHGGGVKCSVPMCQKTTISKGLCWTHGGGKRCARDDCSRPASQSKQNFCSKHQPSASQVMGLEYNVEAVSYSIVQ
ncbi:hypothetical protein PsorP6_014521 [Peronosclerospora sorghi]|uniref:Uncharacterized protein n=1 Tax=Peronosclerospora sorghi TaxID=230839 RepID=A0ACC0VUH3_9STRA|nr:hypothetical protein PsorP6_014521 [Peronosclerospora sorghi]